MLAPLNDTLAHTHAEIRTFGPPRSGAGAARPKDPNMFGELRLKGVADAMNAPPRAYLIKGLLGVGEMSVFCGPPKCGKSFSVSHIAYAVAQGRDVWGHRVVRGAVLYVALEGETGFAKRVRALAARYGACPDFHYIAQPCPMWQRPELANDVIAAAKHIAAVLVIIDTHARCMTGGEENSTKETGEMVGIYDRIRAQTGAAIAIVHHTGKHGGDRGSSALPAAADIWFGVTKDQKTGLNAINIQFAKDDPSGEGLGFRLEVVEVGKDADGEPETTCLVEELGSITPPARSRARLSHAERASFGHILSLFNRDDAPTTDVVPCDGMASQCCVTREDLRTHLEGAGVLLRNADGDPAKESNKLRQRLHRTLTALQAKGVIGFSKTHVWITGGDDDAA